MTKWPSFYLHEFAAWLNKFSCISITDLKYNTNFHIFILISCVVGMVLFSSHSALILRSIFIFRAWLPRSELSIYGQENPWRKTVDWFSDIYRWAGSIIRNCVYSTEHGSCMSVNKLVQLSDNLKMQVSRNGFNIIRSKSDPLIISCIFSTVWILEPNSLYDSLEAVYSHCISVCMHKLQTLNEIT